MTENHKIFIAEAYLRNKEVVYDVRPYGLGIVIDQGDLSKAILDRRIEASIIADRNIRVVT